MLLYFGGRSVHLLDGGWSCWRAQHGPIEIEGSPQRGGSFTVELQRYRRRTLDELQSAHGRGLLPQLVDTRSREEFDGTVATYLPRRGHLPGAALVPFMSLFGNDCRYVARDEYIARLPKVVHEANELVAYCEVGVRASLFALLHEAYTGQVVPVFDGSVVQWALESDLQMLGTSSEPRLDSPGGDLST
jgi:thiosulfate/3-mercaptopyruvate sulfurtransferase